MVLCCPPTGRISARRRPSGSLHLALMLKSLSNELSAILLAATILLISRPVCNVCLALPA